jgi:predicted NUDIX family phosphoesterase
MTLDEEHSLSVTTEQVMTVPTAAVHALFAGRSWVGRKEASSWVATATFVDRGPAEQDPAQKQLITYVVLRCGDLVYSYARGKTGGESRLHALRSIGIGGHVNPDDAGETLAATVRRAAHREFAEEIALGRGNAVRSNLSAGMVNDDESEVGKVHLGVVQIYDLYSTDIEPKEAALADGLWVTPAELWITPNLERWSQIVAQNLFAEGGVL